MKFFHLPGAARTWPDMHIDGQCQRHAATTDSSTEPHEHRGKTACREHSDVQSQGDQLLHKQNKLKEKFAQIKEDTVKLEQEVQAQKGVKTRKSKLGSLKRKLTSAYAARSYTSGGSKANLQSAESLPEKRINGKHNNAHGKR